MFSLAYFKSSFEQIATFVNSHVLISCLLELAPDSSHEVYSLKS